MDAREILSNAIEIAGANGWLGIDQAEEYKILTVPDPDHWNLLGYDENGAPVRHIFESTTDIIYNHDFAKALWGESLIHDMIARNWSRDTPMYADSLFLPVNNWQFHLQQMVIAEDPLQYLADNLPVKYDSPPANRFGELAEPGERVTSFTVDEDGSLTKTED